MERFERGFKGVWIPAKIWLSEELNLIDKVMLAEIDSLDSKKGCFAGNEHFASFCGVSVPTITRSIRKLKDLRYIDVQNSANGRRTIHILPHHFDQPPNHFDQPPNQNDLLLSNSVTNSVASFPEEKKRKTVSLKSPRYLKWERHLLLLKKKVNGFQLPAREKTSDIGVGGPEEIECTKTVVQVIGYLEELESGTFQRTINHQGELILKPMDAAQVYDLLEQSLSVFEKAKSPRYWPQDKKYISKVRVLQFFYNDRSGHSWFMWCLENEPTELEPEAYADIPDEWLKEASRIVGRKSRRLSWELKDLSEWMESVIRKPEIAKQNNWVQFATVDRMMERYFEFVDGYGSGVAPGHFSSEKVQGQFVKWAKKTYEVDLTAQSREFKEGLKEQAIMRPDIDRPDVVRRSIEDAIRLRTCGGSFLVPYDLRTIDDEWYEYTAESLIEEWDHERVWFDEDRDGEVVAQSNRKVTAELVRQMLKDRIEERIRVEGKCM